MKNEFQKFALSQGISSLDLHRYQSLTDAYVSPTVIEERKLNMAQMDFILFHTITTFPNFAPSLKTVKKRTYFCTRPAPACRKKEKFLNTPAFPGLAASAPPKKKT